MENPPSPVSQSLSDEQALFERAKGGPDGVGEVYDRYVDQLYRYFLRRVGQKELAEDFVSQAFEIFLRELPRLEWRGVPIHAWLFRVAGRIVIDHYRSSGVKLRADLEPEVWDPPDATQNPAWYAECQFERGRLLELIKLLPERDQRILDGHFFAQLEARELADLLEISANHASVLVYRAVGKLRSLYLQTYGTH